MKNVLKKSLAAILSILMLVAIVTPAGNKVNAEAVDDPYTIITVAGNGQSGGALPTSIAITTNLNPGNLTSNPSGNLIFHSGNGAYRLESSGKITRIAGTGYSGASNIDGTTKPEDSRFRSFGSIILTSNTMYLLEGANDKIFKTNEDGFVSANPILHYPTSDGNDRYSFHHLAISGNYLYVVQSIYAYPSPSSYHIFRIDLANNNNFCLYAGTVNYANKCFNSGSTLYTESLGRVTGIAVDSEGSLYYSNGTSHTVVKIDTSGTSTVVAGQAGVNSSTGDNQLATIATLNSPYGLTFDDDDNLYIAEYDAHKIRKVDAATQIITTLAGTGTKDYTGDNGPANLAALNNPMYLHYINDTLYVTDRNNNRIRAIKQGYVLSFDGNGATEGHTPPQAIVGSTVSTAVPDNVGDLTKTGYTFKEWNTAADGSGTSYQAGSPITLNSNTTLYAQWEISAFTLTYTAGDNGTIDHLPTVTQSVYQGDDAATVTAIPDSGYHFVSWSDGSASAERTDTNIQSDISVTAQFASLNKTVTFNTGNGSSIDNQTVTYNTFAAEPESPPTRTGYDFAGWYTTAAATTPFEFATMPIVDNTEIFAKWTIKSYSLQYSAGDHGTLTGNATQNVNHGANGTSVTAVPNSGYYFVKWSDNVTTATRTDEAVTASLNVTASYSKHVYTVQFNSNDGSSIDNQNVEYNTFATEPATPPTRTGYDFAGWYTTAAATTPFDFATMPIVDNTEIFAKWTIKSYSLQYSAGDHGTLTGNAAQNVNHGANGTSVTAVPNSGYYFVKWSDNVTTATRTDEAVTASLNVTASYSQHVYTVQFNSNGGSSVNSQNVAYNDYAVPPVTNPSRTAYLFTGWYTDAAATQPFVFASTLITGPITLYAGWELAPPDTFTLQPAVAGDGKVTLSWTSSTHADSYIIYQSTTSNSYTTSLDTVTSSVYSYNVTGLTNGTPYYFVVTAVNTAGDVTSNEVTATPFTTASAPTITNIEAKDSAVTITFDEPIDNGGSIITGYKVTILPDNTTVIGSSSPITVSGLTNGTAYTFTVQAINEAGDGIRSNESASVIPKKPPVTDGGGGIPDITAPGEGTPNETTPDGNTSDGKTPDGDTNTKSPFIDIRGHWAEDTITKALQQDIIQGYSDNTFKPNALITREEFITMLVNGLKIEVEGEVDLSLSFTDRDKIAQWSFDAIAKLVHQGAITGYEDGSFRPSAHIKRSEMAVIIAQVLGLIKDDSSSSFADDANIPLWAKSAIAALQKEGIVNGRNGNLFDSHENMTRAEAISIIMRILDQK